MANGIRNTDEDPAINPVKDPLAYQKMIAETRTFYALRLALANPNAPITKLETQLALLFNDENRYLYNERMLDFLIESQNKEKEAQARIQSANAASSAQEELILRELDEKRRQESGKSYDKKFFDIGSLTTDVIKQQLYLHVNQLIASQAKIAELENKLKTLTLASKRMDKEWVETKLKSMDECLALIAADPKTKDLAIAVAKYDEKGNLIPEVDTHGNEKKDAKGETVFQVEWVQPNSERGKKLMDVHNLMRSEKHTEATAPAYSMSTTLQAILPSFKIVPTAAPAVETPLPDATYKLPDAKEKPRVRKQHAKVEVPPAGVRPAEPAANEKLEVDAAQILQRENQRVAFLQIVKQSTGDKEVVRISPNLVRKVSAKNKEFNDAVFNFNQKKIASQVEQINKIVENANSVFDSKQEIHLERANYEKKMHEAVQFANALYKQSGNNVDVKYLLELPKEAREKKLLDMLGKLEPAAAAPRQNKPESS